MGEEPISPKKAERKRRKALPKGVKLPKKERLQPEEGEPRVSKKPWAGVVLVLLAAVLVIVEDYFYRKERSSLLTMVEEWVLPGKKPATGRASVNASRSLEYRQSLMVGQGFLRSSRLNPETAEDSLAMALYHFRVALKQLGDDPKHERSRLKLESRIASIEKALGAVSSPRLDVAVPEKEDSVDEGSVSRENDEGGELP